MQERYFLCGTETDTGLSIEYEVDSYEEAEKLAKKLRSEKDYSKLFCLTVEWPEEESAN